jgi:hypothetical protein
MRLLLINPTISGESPKETFRWSNAYRDAA